MRFAVIDDAAPARVAAVVGAAAVQTESFSPGKADESDSATCREAVLPGATDSIVASGGTATVTVRLTLLWCWCDGHSRRRSIFSVSKPSSVFTTVPSRTSVNVVPSRSV